MSKIDVRSTSPSISAESQIFEKEVTYNQNVVDFPFTSILDESGSVVFFWDFDEVNVTMQVGYFCPETSHTVNAILFLDFS